MVISVALTKSYLEALTSLPKGIQKKANEFFEKFKTNPDMASINFESLAMMKDDKIRTVRIDQKYRAVLLHPPEGNIYIFVHIDNHDEAMDWAKNKVFDINPRTQALQVMEVEKLELPFLNQTAYESPEAKESICDSYSEEELLSIGIPEMLIPALKQVTNKKELEEQIKPYVSSNIYDVLEYCLEKIPTDNIKDDFGISFVEQPMANYEQVLQNRVNQPYIKVVSDDQDIMAVLENPIDYWRMFVHPKQSAYIMGNKGTYPGSFQLKGAAGTGKTVVAIHRAKYLAENVYTAKTDSILFTTFSRKLTSSVEYNLKNMCSMRTLSRIEVNHLHGWIATFLADNGISFSIIDSETRESLIKEALEITRQNKFQTDFIKKEIDYIIAPNLIRSLSDYQKVIRTGGLNRLGKNQRESVWLVISEYFKLLEKYGLTEWWLLIIQATTLIKEKKHHPYQAIIVDESQDFGMAEYHLLRALIPPKENDLFIVGDIRQRIYNGRAVFSKVGINIRGNRTRNLWLNYRNTRQISELAESILGGQVFIDYDGMKIGEHKTITAMSGVQPEVRMFADVPSEADFISSEINRIIQSGIQPEEIAIVARTRAYVKKIQMELLDKGIDVNSLDSSELMVKNQTYLGTMHGIKGFEFKIVFLAGMNEDLMPLEQHLQKLDSASARKDFLQRETSLLYVALTRARDAVYVTSSAELSSWLGKKY